MIEVLIGVIGILVGWVIARTYYQKAGNDLREEAEKLRKESERVRQKVDLVLVGFEVAKLATLYREDDGEITGFHVSGDLTLAISGVQAKGQAGTVSPK